MLSESRAFMNDFLEESAHLAASMTRLRDRIRSSPTEHVLLRELSREVHTLQGILLLVDFPQLKERAQRLHKAIAAAERQVAGNLDPALGILDEVVRGIEQIHRQTKGPSATDGHSKPNHSSDLSPAPMQTILVVDDSRTIQQFVQLVLEQAGFLVVSASTPSMAMAAIESSKPALILLDLSVAKQDGGELQLQMILNGIFQRVPVVIFSHEAENVLRSHAEWLGAAGYLQKTGITRDIVATVSAHLKK
jgi:PleD family two-component response regulator